MTQELSHIDELIDLVLSAEGVTRARSHGKGVQEFRSVDPLASVAPGLTPYRYGFNNPISYTDPTGMFESSNSLYQADYEKGQKDNEEGRINARKAEVLGTTIDVVAENFSDSGLNTEEIINVVSGASKILSRSIDANFSFHFVESSTGGFYGERDRTLYLGYSKNAPFNIGNSDFNWQNRLRTVQDINGVRRPLSGVNTGNVTASQGLSRSYMLSYVSAHELAHQLDVFSRLRYMGSLNSLPFEGHYESYPNLLNSGNNFLLNSANREAKELLPISASALINRYVND